MGNLLLQKGVLSIGWKGLVDASSMTGGGVYCPACVSVLCVYRRNLAVCALGGSL